MFLSSTRLLFHRHTPKPQKGPAVKACQPPGPATHTQFFKMDDSVFGPPASPPHPTSTPLLRRLTNRLLSIMPRGEGTFWLPLQCTRVSIASTMMLLLLASHSPLPPSSYARTGMEPVQQEERRSLGEEEEHAGGPTYLLPPDSEGNNDAEDDKLVSALVPQAYTNPLSLAYRHHQPIHSHVQLPLKSLPAAISMSVVPICSTSLEQASNFSHPPSPKSPPRGRWKDGLCDWHKNCAPSCTYPKCAHL